jgi:hypothetical protein
MASGLDFFPTILSWTKTQKPSDLKLDGADISTLLSKNPQDASLVKTDDALVRNSIMHHFPNSAAMQSTLRIDGWKLIRNYLPSRPKLELYKLYDEDGKRVDIEESKNLAKEFRDKAKTMNQQLQSELLAMDASFPYKNPYYNPPFPNTKEVPQPTAQGQTGSEVWMSYQNKGNSVDKAYLMYTLNGGDKYEEWFRMEATVESDKITAKLPKGSTHYLFNLIDDKNFLISYPRMGQMRQFNKGNYSTKAFKVKIHKK